MPSLTERAARFVVETKTDRVPERALKVARDAFLDCSGVMMAALKDPVADIVHSYIKERPGLPVATVFGGGVKTFAEDAAFANGILAHALDYDDVHVGCAGHVSVVLVPAILALGEELGTSGMDALVAYVIGFELIHRLGRQVAGPAMKLGFHATALWAPVGAAAAAARLLRLDVDQTRMALGMAASSAGGLSANSGSMTKGFHAGNGARGGIVAAKLARKGFTAASDILEHDRGYIRVFSQAPVAEDAMETLGEVYTLSDGLEFKRFPSCGKSQSGIESALHLVNAHDIRAEDVEEIVCDASDLVPRMALFHHNPATGLHAKFSMEYGVAAAILDRAAGLAQFTDEAVTRPAARELMGRFSYRHPEHLRGQAGFLTSEKITFRLRDGREVSHQGDNPEGAIGSAVTTEILVAKCRDCLSLVLPPAACERSLELLRNLDKLDNIAELTAVLGGSDR